LLRRAGSFATQARWTRLPASAAATSMPAPRLTARSRHGHTPIPTLASCLCNRTRHVDELHPPAQGRCDGRASGVTAGIVDTPVQALQLGCRFTGRVAGELRLMEPRLAGAGTRQAREGRATFGGIVIDIRSEHALAGTPLPLSQPAGYRLIIQGRDVAALDLAGGKPVLRSAAGLEPELRAALTQAALALGLLFDPAVTLG
jgi:hypothetical protein